MKTFKKLTGLGVIALMAASVGTVYAEEGDLTQTRTQERDRLELNLQTADSDFGQPAKGEEHTVLNKTQNQYQNQHQYQFKNMNNFQNGSGESAQDVMSDRMEKNSWQGSNSASAMNRTNMMSRHMQGSNAGAVNRQSAARNSGRR